MNIRHGFLIPCAFLSLGAAAGDGPELAGALKDALLCKGNPLEAVQRVAKHATYDLGIASVSFGRELEARTVFVLREPIVIAGVPTRAVIKELSPSNDRFNAIVYAEFEGKPKEVIKALGLKADSAGGKPAVGVYMKALGKDQFGNKDGNCPKTIGLTPLPNGGFLLGCGWCNG